MRSTSSLIDDIYELRVYDHTLVGVGAVGAYTPNCACKNSVVLINFNTFIHLKSEISLSA